MEKVRTVNSAVILEAALDTLDIGTDDLGRLTVRPKGCNQRIRCRQVLEGSIPRVPDLVTLQVTQDVEQLLRAAGVELLRYLDCT